jgi:putative aldouronate transport system permease protein
MPSPVVKNQKEKRSSLISGYSFSRNIQLYALLFLPLMFFLVFKYAPMYGILIAFKDYNIFQGVFKSPWAGVSVFKEIFKISDFITALRNTFMLNLLD